MRYGQNVTTEAKMDDEFQNPCYGLHGMKLDRSRDIDEGTQHRSISSLLTRFGPFDICIWQTPLPELPLLVLVQSRVPPLTHSSITPWVAALASSHRSLSAGDLWRILQEDGESCSAANVREPVPARG
jgi:hypothetical protein